MRVECSGSLNDYVSTGEATVRELVAENGPLVQLLCRYSDFFTRTLWVDEPEFSPIAATLAMNAFMTFLAGTRIAMTGHASAIFPTLRTALEYACYAFLVTDDPTQADVWLNRHKSPASRKANREAFTGAVKRTAEKLNAIQPQSGDCVFAAYEAAIDFGGHPNPKGVFLHLGFGEDVGDEYHRMVVAGLYGHDHPETIRALVGCLDLGLVTAIVLARCRGAISEEVERALSMMNDLKDRIVADLA